MSLKQNLTDLFSYMQDQYLEWIDQLPSLEKERVGEVDDWSVKDEIFHNMEWANRRLAMAETIEQGKKWSDIDYGDYDEENRRIFERFQHASWTEARELINTTYKEITDLINRISEDILRSIPEGQENPLWQSITGSYILHPMSHYWGYLIKMNSLDRLVKIFGRDFSDWLIGLNDSEKWQAVPRYNLACIYALAGDAEKSIQELEIALKLNPEFIEWAHKDPDLESIRSDPSFKTLMDSLD
jgi:hypothetical protein